MSLIGATTNIAMSAMLLGAKSPAHLAPRDSEILSDNHRLEVSPETSQHDLDIAVAEYLSCADEYSPLPDGYISVEQYPTLAEGIEYACILKGQDGYDRLVVRFKPEYALNVGYLCRDVINNAILGNTEAYIEDNEQAKQTQGRCISTFGGANDPVGALQGDSFTSLSRGQHGISIHLRNGQVIIETGDNLTPEFQLSIDTFMEKIFANMWSFKDVEQYYPGSINHPGSSFTPNSDISAYAAGGLFTLVSLGFLFGALLKRIFK